MEQVIREYGQFLLSGIVTVFVISLLFVELRDVDGNIGAFKIFGKTVEIQSIEYEDYTDFKEIYLEEGRKKFPKIEYISGHLKTGKIRLGEHIKAIDYADTELKIKITMILGPDGEEMLEKYDAVTTEIIILEPGIYTVYVEAIDEGNRLTECIIKMPVIR